MAIMKKGVGVGTRSWKETHHDEIHHGQVDETRVRFGRGDAGADAADGSKKETQTPTRLVVDESMINKMKAR